MQLMQMVIIRMQIQPSEASLDAKYVGMGARFPGSQRFVGFVPARKHTIKLTDRTTVFRHDVIGRVKWNLKVSRCSFVLVYRACSINQLLFSITFARHFSAKTIWTQHSANLFQTASRLPSISKSKVGHPQYPRQVLPLPHTHLEAPPFLPQPKGCCSPPSQDDIKTNVYQLSTSLCAILLRNI